LSEELIQRNLIEAPEKMGDWNFYNIGATTLKALKGAKIIPDKDYEAYEGKKPDALIVKKPIIIAAIEYKTPQELRTEKQIAKAIAQEIGTAQILQAKVYIVTDGKKTFWINPATGQEILQEDGSRITLNFDKSSTECITLINKIRASINATNNQIKAAASVDPLPLAEKVWQDLWAVSGATPENCLYTFVEIFIFKYLSDLGVLKGMYSFYDLLGKYSGNNENEVLEYYASTVRVKIKALFPGNPKDKTTIINGTIFVSKDDKAVSGYATVFHKILKRFNDFGTLENIDYDFKSKLFETFLKEFTLEPIFRELAKGRKGDNGEDEFTKLYPSMLSNIMVPIPVDGKGNISLLLQKEIAQKFISVQNSQKEIIEKLDALISKKISI
jgi:type I restriction-modification system methyltransferase subunit